MGAPKLSPHMGLLAKLCPSSVPMSEQARAAFERRHELFPGEDRVATTDLTRSTPRGRLYQEIVRRYRRPKRTPGFVGDPVLDEHPAPDWVWRLAKDILEHTGREHDQGRAVVQYALTWCEAGPNPALRAARLVSGDTLPSMGPVQDAKYLHDLRAILDGEVRS